MPPTNRRRVAVASLIAVAAASLAGCSQPYVVDPAPYAGDPVCAEIMLPLVDGTVGGLEQRDTTSQATLAFGEEYPIVVRCGVEPPGPTTDQCLSIDLPDTTVDWIVVEEGEDWLATSFGRSPALEARVPKVRADEAIGDVLAELSRVAAIAPVNGLACS